MEENLKHINALSGFLTSPTHHALARDNGFFKLGFITTEFETKEIEVKAKEIMHRGVTAIEKSETVEAAAHRMRDADIGVLPVVSGGKVVGVVTDRDIVTRCLARDQDYHRASVSECMTTNVICASQDEDVKEVSKKMRDQKISRVFIEDNQHNPVGLISVEDLVHHSDPKLFTQTMSVIKS